MTLTKGLRWLTVIGAVTIGATVTVRSVSAQDEGDAKTAHTAIHAAGSVAIAPTACPSAAPSTGVACYSITSTTLKQGKVVDVGLTGTLVAASTGVATPKNSKTRLCYTISNLSTEAVTNVATSPIPISITTGDACVTSHTDKAKDTTTYSEVGTLSLSADSPLTGKAKEVWTVAPATADTLAGDGKVSVTGSVTP
jgi:hypothetical protein